MIDRIDPARLRSILVVAVLVGVLAGLTSAVLHTFVGEPLIRQAIAREEARDAAAGPGAGEPELVSRSVQSGVGLFFGLGLGGAAFGLLFALTFWGLRSGRPDPFRRALVAGVILFGSLSLAPWLKYPPNPPAVGDPDTIDRRQALFVSLIALSLALSLIGAAVAGRTRRWPEHRRVAAVTLAVGVPFALALALLPPAPDPVDAPATLIWRFRLASLGGNALLWAVLALGVGLLLAEATRRRQPAVEPGAADAGTPTAASP
jgi:predicted cobalt transporter CbtA